MFILQKQKKSWELQEEKYNRQGRNTIKDPKRRELAGRRRTKMQPCHK